MRRSYRTVNSLAETDNQQYAPQLSEDLLARLNVLLDLEKAVVDTDDMDLSDEAMAAFMPSLEGSVLCLTHAFRSIHLALTRMDTPLQLTAASSHGWRTG